MVYTIYSETEETSSSVLNRNIVTIARALNGKKLNKTIYKNGHSIPYDNAFYYKFFNKEIECLDDLCQLVSFLLGRPQSCLIRGIAKDDSINKQRRLFYDDKKTGDPATIIEQEQNWYALDIDGYGQSTGNLKLDTKNVLLALGLDNVQAFAIPSASYMIKEGIRIRLFLWNSMKVSCLTLKKYFDKIVDPALFHPIQPIYVARPTFVDMNDPCKERIAWIPGEQIYTEIVDVLPYGGSNSQERKYTKKQAEAFLRNPRPVPKHIDSRILWEYKETERHPALFKVAVFMGKLIWQEVLDEDIVVEDLMDNCAYYWGGNAKNDLRTILDGIKRGKQRAMEGNDEF